MKRIQLLVLMLLFPLVSLQASDHPSFQNFSEDSMTGNKNLTIFKVKNKLSLTVKTRSFTENDKKKLKKAIIILEKVMNSPELESMIKNFKFKGEQRFHRNNGMTNQEIYDHLMTGAEDLKQDIDHTMNFDLTMYRSWNPWSKVKGYTKPDTMRIWIHSKFYRRSSWTPIDVAANMAHEWVHKMGFGHDYNYNEDRPYSVPYAIGGLVGKVAKKLNLDK